jgi:hypothetical protein
MYAADESGNRDAEHEAQIKKAHSIAGAGFFATNLT